jgi:putative membrane-bound dehydrogenase-like protein
MFLAGLVFAGLGIFRPTADAAEGEKTRAAFQAGFARADITPTEPVRLSGYAGRSTPMEGSDGPIYVRAVAIKAGDSPPQVLAAVETIGFPGALAKEIFEQLPAEIQDDRSRFVMTAIHSHTCPHVARGLSNLFTQSLSEEEQAATERYTDLMRDKTVEAVKAALADLKTARLFVGEGETSFARNRRLLQNKAWVGFGEVPEGSVDHSVPVLRITDESGNKTRGLLFNYACHCTTFGPGHNRVNGDWAGYACHNLEAGDGDVMAICTIGCGADANPEREGPMQLELSKKQGRMLSDEVQRVAGGKLREITVAPVTTFAYAGLPIDRPTIPELNERLKSADPNTRRHAETMLDIQNRMGRLPETHPMPIQSWRFGNEFAMVFLGGEVVVDYALRIKQEFGTDPAAPEAGKIETPLWVTAYANDIFGYVASERVRGEGGYEVDGSMIYYNQPGRWSTGTEEVVMRRVKEVLENKAPDRALSVSEALKAFSIPEGYTIECIASEPLITDPINFALGPDGRLWVVEMGDYPRGKDGHGKAGGRIQVLSDKNQDGAFDTAVTFLDDLAFPTGVFPWRDGAFVSGAPDVIFAKDTDGDGKADTREVLFSGFIESNPQHRISGFTWGLDGWLYLASGESSQDILCHKTGETINIAGRDIRIHPDSGKLEPISGKSQYGRCRDDFNNWFGNNNSEPLYHYVIDDGDLRRNPFVPSPSPIHHVTDPPAIPPVYPTSRTLDRFNDLWAANRFTSACSPLIVRDDRLPADLNGAALICEPVHNLIVRYQLNLDGLSFQATRLPSEQMSEFISSTDGWFRPVRTMTAPDGSIWIADMYRKVIEHPEWIPEAWQAQLNLRAGEYKGRIYRVAPKSLKRAAASNLCQRSSEELAGALASRSGVERDLVQQLLVERADKSVLPQLEKMASGKESAAGRVQALWTVAILDSERAESLVSLFQHLSADVRRNAIRALAENEPRSKRVRKAVLDCAQDDDIRVLYELALVLGNWAGPDIGPTLGKLAVSGFDDPWMRAAVLSSSRNVADVVLREVLTHVSASDTRTEMVGHLTATILGDQPENGALKILGLVVNDQGQVQDWQLAALAACIQGLARSDSSLAKLAAGEKLPAELTKSVQRIFEDARRQVENSAVSEERHKLAISLLGRGPDQIEEDRERLKSLLSPQQPGPIQEAALKSLTADGRDEDAELVLAAWRTMEPETRGAALSLLLSRPGWIRQLLGAIEKGRVPSAELTATARAALVENPDDGIRELAQAVLKPSAARGEVLGQYRSVIGMTGVAQCGAAVFQKTCAACHRLHDLGNDVGAKLGALQNKSTENLLTAILDPNRGVEGKFISYAAATKDGRTFTGMIVEEGATSITLARPDGKRDVLLRIDIESLVSSGKSFMPEGLERELSPQDVADVIAFVQAD